MQLKQNIKSKLTDWLSGRLVTIRSQPMNCIWENTLIERPNANVIDQHVTVLRISIPSWIPLIFRLPERQHLNGGVGAPRLGHQHFLVAIIRTTVREVITASRYLQYKVELQEKKGCIHTILSKLKIQRKYSFIEGCHCGAVCPNVCACGTAQFPESPGNWRRNTSNRNIVDKKVYSSRKPLQTKGMKLSGERTIRQQAKIEYN